MVVARKYVLVKHFEGEPKQSDFLLTEEELPTLKDGGARWSRLGMMNYCCYQFDRFI